jgi:hypothetical protein
MHPTRPADVEDRFTHAAKPAIPRDAETHEQPLDEPGKKSDEPQPKTTQPNSIGAGRTGRKRAREYQRQELPERKTQRAAQLKRA